MNYALTYAMVDYMGDLSCGLETIASKAACKKVVDSYVNRAEEVIDKWSDHQFPYGEYTELRLANGNRLVLCIEQSRF